MVDQQYEFRFLAMETMNRNMRSAIAPNDINSLWRRSSSCSFFQQFGGGVHSGADAIRNAYARIGIPCQRQAGQFLTKSYDSRQSIKMPNHVLSHGAIPAINDGEQRAGGDCQDTVQIAADDFDDRIVIQLHVIVRIGTTEEAPDQGGVFRRTEAEFVVNKRRGQNFNGFTFGRKKSETLRQQRADSSIESQGHDDR